MIGLAGTIGIEPRWFAHPITKPGYGDPEPMKVEPISAMDSPENVAACLSCALPVCRPGCLGCHLRGKKPVVQRRGGRKSESV